jgi:Flp pilus assembly protein TadG
MAPLLLLLMFGVADFSRMFGVADQVVGAARAATQYGMMSPAHYGDFTGMASAAFADAPNVLNLAVTASEFCTCTIGGTQLACPATCTSGTEMIYLKVVTSAPFTTLLSYPMVSKTTQLKSVSIIRVQ